MFRRAVKRDAKLRLALSGPAGSGKTYSLLAIATGLGGGIAYVDTERGSASKYADLFAFDVVEPAEFDPRQLIEIIGAAVAGGYDAICIDSLSHYWMGKGGELEMVAQAAKRSQSNASGGNGFAAWKHVTPVHNRLAPRPDGRDWIDTMLAAPIHVLAAMRTKTEWVIEKDERGRNVPRKIGTQPAMREGIEFEFDVCGDLDQDNTLRVTKSRCPELSGKSLHRPGKEMAETLKQWLAGAEELSVAPQVEVAAEVPAEVRALWDRMGNSKIEVHRTLEEVHGILVEAVGFDAAGEIYEQVAEQYPMGAGKDPIRIGNVRRTVWELWNAAQEAKRNAAKGNAAQEGKGKAARREAERLPREGAHGN
jgi:hypothetical protein